PLSSFALCPSSPAFGAFAQGDTSPPPRFASRTAPPPYGLTGGRQGRFHGVPTARRNAPMSRRSILHRLAREARPYYPRIAVATVLGALAGVLTLVPPTAFRIIINRVLAP